MDEIKAFFAACGEVAEEHAEVAVGIAYALCTIAGVAIGWKIQKAVNTDLARRIGNEIRR